MNAVDTNVFVYALDVDEPAKQAKAQNLLDRLSRASDPTVMLWQVAGELLSNLSKRQSAGRMTASEVETYFHSFLSMFPLAVPNSNVFSIYFGLRARFSLSHWDALVIAACKDFGVTTLFSEDLDHGTDYGGINVVNPFA
jgi:predicted nucleic acid-binding protein